ncbi:hypothetical protein FEM48_Zijuj10G0007700 [Ziziphus jujuba var. spinosa]|uniref:Small auxin-up RNA n=1 Tax=Ziziphus jujuba var. spinosa TaxID=714518 RepID=A0A978UKA6_ZIZJJ|nr:hypothetical protein FEM48_Zijuj10G0007700 [Ziziphus jujuba var. spinosa]
MAFTGKRRIKTIGKSIQVKQMIFVKRLIKTLGLSFFSSKTITTTSTTSGCVPSGYLPVYVGWNRVRFLIPTGFLKFPIFMFLLDKAYEEFGFKFSGGIVLPCEVEFFKKLFKLLQKDEKRYASLKVDEILNILVSDHMI